jgi:hypothetical protein
MNKFKIGDRVRAVKDSDAMESNWIGKVEAINQNGTQLKVKFDAYYLATPDEIELIEPLQLTEQDKEWLSSRPTIADKPTPKPFPTFEEFNRWFFKEKVDHNKQIYNYFAQFGVRTVEVPLELGKMYEFSSDKKNWEKRLFHGYSTIMGGETKYYPCIRPIQPSRLEQLKARKSELSKDELLELVELMEKEQ